MKRALCFTLTGRTAFFKKPEVNSYLYFTYSHIHKVALLGIFGAILGLGGHRQVGGRQGAKVLVPSFPEFYDRLKSVNISILPNNEKGYISKKVQVFNNSVGYASQELGGNLIVREQWLEDPSWDVFVLLDSEESESLAAAIMDSRCVYMPYLGKNDHPADILNPRILELEPNSSEKLVLHCLFPESAAKAVELDFDEQEAGVSYCYTEYLPVGMDPLTNQHLMKRFNFTDSLVHGMNITVNHYNGRNFIFY